MGRRWRDCVAQATADGLGHLHPNFDVPVEADAVGSQPKGWRLAHVMQQRSPGQSTRRGVGKILEQQQRVDKHIAFRMVLRRLFHPFHGGDFRQHLAQQSGFVEQLKGPVGAAFGQHLAQLVAHPLLADLVDL